MTTALTAPAVELLSNRLGYARLLDRTGSVEAANRMLQKTRDEFHALYRDVSGHNHMAHSVLTVKYISTSLPGGSRL
jgi:hypothetical protein